MISVIRVFTDICTDTNQEQELLITGGLWLNLVNFGELYVGV